MNKFIAKAIIDTCSTGDKFLRLTSCDGSTLLNYESFGFYAEGFVIEQNAAALSPAASSNTTTSVTSNVSTRATSTYEPMGE